MPTETASPARATRAGRTRFVQFCAVGLTGMVVDFGSFHALRFAGLVGKWHLGWLSVPVANMFSVAIAIQWNFLGNRRFTFQDRDAPLATAWWRFNVFSSTTWALNQLIVGGLVAWWGPDTVARVDIENLWKLIAIAICTAANYWLSAQLAFRARRPREPGASP